MKTMVMLLFAAALPAAAQITFSRTYFPVQDNTWTVSDVQQTSDGGYAAVTTVGGYMTGQALLMRTDGYGDALWTAQYGDWTDEGATNVLPAKGDGFMVGGFYGGQLTDHPYDWLIRTDSNGVILSSHIYSGMGVRRQIKNGDGHAHTSYYVDWFNYYMCSYLILTDSNGVFIQGGSYCVGEETLRVSLCLAPASGGAFVLAGYYSDQWDPSAYDAMFLWMTSYGNPFRLRTYGGADQDEVRWIEQLHDGGFIAAGNTRSFGSGGWDGWLLRLDYLGDTLWTRTYGDSLDNTFSCVQLASDGGFIMAGKTYLTGGLLRTWLIKTDPSGNIEWERVHHVTTGSSGCHVVRQTYDGGYIMSGTASGLLFLIKTDSQGLVSVSDAHAPMPQTISLTAAPNPFNPSTVLSFSLPERTDARLEIFDVLGRRVMTLVDESLPAGEHRRALNAGDCASGVYFARLSTDAYEGSTRLVLLK